MELVVTAELIRENAKNETNLPRTKEDFETYFQDLVKGFDIPNDDQARLIVAQSVMNHSNSSKNGFRSMAKMESIANDFFAGMVYGTAYGIAQPIKEAAMAKAKAEQEAQKQNEEALSDKPESA